MYGKLLYPTPSASKQTNFARDGYPALITFLSGATAGMVAAICTHPFDVLKTKQQVAAWHNNSSNNTITSTTISNPAKSSNPTNLANGLYNGLPTSPNNTLNSTTPSVEVPIRYTLSGVYRAGGIRALFRGLSMRLATVIPASAIMITIYEAIKKVDVDL